jgi:hypothetical protein
MKKTWSRKYRVSLPLKSALSGSMSLRSELSAQNQHIDLIIFLHTNFQKYSEQPSTY